MLAVMKSGYEGRCSDGESVVGVGDGADGVVWGVGEGTATVVSGITGGVRLAWTVRDSVCSLGVGGLSGVGP
jgi:hypothetical protein